MSISTAAEPRPATTVLEGAYKKATWHLIPFIFVCSFCRIS